MVREPVWDMAYQRQVIIPTPIITNHGWCLGQCGRTQFGRTSKIVNSGTGTKDKVSPRKKSADGNSCSCCGPESEDQSDGFAERLRASATLLDTPGTWST